MENEIKQLKLNNTNERNYNKYFNDINEKTPKRNYSNNKDYMNSQKERELKSLNEKVAKLQKELDNNKKMYNDKIKDLNDKLKNKDKEFRLFRDENININKTCQLNGGMSNYDSGKMKSYSQDKAPRNHYLIKNSQNTCYREIIETKGIKTTQTFETIRTFQNSKIAYLNECLKEKEEELTYLKKCLEQKENELKIFTEKNSKIKRAKIPNKNNIKENELYEQIEIFENQIENKNKEISLLKKEY